MIAHALRARGATRIHSARSASPAVIVGARAVQLRSACTDEPLIPRPLELVDTLRAHAGREDHLLYRWADQNLDHALVTAALAHATH